MIKTFADRRTRQLYETGTTKRFPPDLARRAARKLEYLDLAFRLDDLKYPPGNRLHTLSGDRKGQYSISINDQWRICFRFVDGDVFDVEPTLFTTPSAAAPPGRASATFRSVAGPHRTGEYASGPLGRETPRLHGLAAPRDERVVNKVG